MLLAGGIVAGLFVGAALLLGWEQLLPWALGVLGSEYAGSLFIRGGTAGDVAPLYGAALLLLGELVAWSISLRTRMKEEPPVLVLRLGALAAATTGSVVVGGLLLWFSTARVGGGLVWAALGTVAAVGTIALVARAAARS